MPKKIAPYLLSFLIAAQGTAAVFAFAQTAPAAPSGQAASSSVQTREDLQAQIQQKAQDLQALNQKLSATRQSLLDTQKSKSTLQQQLRLIQDNIDALNLGIQSDQIIIQKLGLEAQSLQYDLHDITSSVGTKEAAIAQILKEIQQHDNADQNLLTIFLRNGSIADSVLEAQALSDLQSQLVVDISNLKDLHDQYEADIQSAQTKQQNIALHQENLKNRNAIIQDQKSQRQALLAQTKDQEGAYQKQLAVLQAQQAQIENEIESIESVLRAKINPSLLPAPGRGVLMVPIDGGLADITQGYGSTAFAVGTMREGSGHWHNGIDIGVPPGTPVFAAEAGTVVALGNQDAYCYRGAYGKFIVIQHDDNLVTLYGHLSRQVVKKGQTVARGDLIAYSGNTGNTTGPHLHFTVYAGPTFYMGYTKSCGPMPYGGDLNPLSYL